MNKDPIFHFPHGPVLFSTCQGLVTRLDEEGGGDKKENEMKEKFLFRHLEEVEWDEELRGAGKMESVNDTKREDQRGKSERGRSDEEQRT